MQYDLVVVVDPKTEEKEAQQKITALLEKEGFLVSDVASWGKKKLAYPLHKQTEGIYLSYVLGGNDKNPSNLYAKFKLEEYVMRALVLKKVEKKKKGEK